MLRSNYERPLAYAARSPEHRAWVETHDRWGLEYGRRLPAILDAVRAGRREVHDDHGRVVDTIDLRVWSPENAPSRLVRNISAPTLVIHGAADLNVPVDDAELLVAALRDAGNADLEAVIVPDADHAFHHVAPDEDERLRERMSMASLRRPWVERYFDHVADFLGRHL
jgi:hypothetical protein